MSHPTVTIQKPNNTITIVVKPDEKVLQRKLIKKEP